MDQTLQTLLSDVKNGHRLSEDECLTLFSVRDRQVWQIAAAADAMREQRACWPWRGKGWAETVQRSR